MCLCFFNRQTSTKALRRPIEFTEAAPLSKTVNLIRISGWGKKLRLISPDTAETIADIKFLGKRTCAIALPTGSFYIHKPRPCSYSWTTEGAFKCDVEQLCCSVEFSLRCQDKEFRLVMTNCCKDEYAVFELNEVDGVVQNTKVMEMKKITRWSERFKFRYAEDLSDEFVACVAFFMTLARSSDR